MADADTKRVKEARGFGSCEPKTKARAVAEREVGDRIDLLALARDELRLHDVLRIDLADALALTETEPPCVGA